ncbi:HPt (histidine-containing phosphotransfer) domain-containing protein [Humidesulfovibrio mexicanus]|uniref:HPt (Histidine-containing phosphotransfer) domain-containing protein n=1 Tax=Humidesulfovibrio mexicanus TaxID=147047 RepID=A0A238XPZ0_9BACT|nr:Hpt domain-containing protein [Humidesulfovibrio mexicanus]SNR60611.1 HPt (histidine-containing phosphotransfer) domain-containing protein [Humidesulfovibrio mexicanus]
MPDDQPPPINREWLKRMRENKPALLHELCAMFLKDEPERIKTIRSAVETGDLELARYHAHSLKGAAAVMGMAALCDACRDVEYAARDAQADVLPVRLERLDRAAKAVCDAMRVELPQT